MKKVVLTIVLAFTMAFLINACTTDNDDKTYEEINAIDNDEVDDDEI